MNDTVTPWIGRSIVVRPYHPSLPDPAANTVYLDDLIVETDGNGEFSTPLTGLEDSYYTVYVDDSKPRHLAGPFQAPADGSTIDLADIIALVPSPILPLDATALRAEFAAADNALEAELRADFIADANKLSADKTGLTDASADVQAWLDDAIASSRGAYAPAGRYLLNDADVASGLSAAEFSIIGDGPGVTEFIVPASNTDGAFLFDGTGNPKTAKVLLRDFSIVTRGVGQGTAIKFEMSSDGATQHRTVIVENVHIYGEDKDTDCFDIGIDLSGTYRSYLRNVTITGPWGPGIVDNVSDASPRFVATASVVLDNVYDWLIDGCHFTSAYTNIRDVGTNAEAGRVHDTQIVSCRVGIQRTRTGREPHFQVEDCHINARDSAIAVDGGKIVFIRGCHFYNTDTTNAFSGTARDIYLKNSEMVLANDNVFHFDGATDRVHVHVDSTTFGEKITIANNLFNSVATNAVLIGTAADNVTLLGNQYTGTYTKRVVDNSGKAVRFDSVDGMWRMSNQNVGATPGPVQQLMRDSVSPAANDLLARLSMLGRDSTDVETEYAAIQAQILTATNGSQAAALRLFAQLAGTLTELAKYTPPATGETAMWGLVNRSGAYTLERFTYGATDSGGTGKRAVTIPN